MPAPFDAQADQFDRRAGLPAGVAERVGQAVVRAAGLEPGDTLLDVGAGTGIVGLELQAFGLRYVGFDLSEAMLDVFRARLQGGSAPRLVHADANGAWPAPDASVSCVFGSRSMHWVAAEHVASECARVADPRGCTLLVGRVRRDPAAFAARMRRQLHRLLQARGGRPRKAERALAEVEAACSGRGARPLETLEVARWTTRRSPSELLHDWASKPGLAGVDLDASDRREVLDALAAWTRSNIGPIDTPREVRQRYVLEGARFGPDLPRQSP